MRGNSGLILIGGGLVLLYAVLSGKYAVFETFVYDLFEIGGGASAAAGPTVQAPPVKSPAEIIEEETGTQRTYRRPRTVLTIPPPTRIRRFTS